MRKESCCKEARVCLNEIQKSSCYSTWRACMCKCAHVWDLVHVSLHLHTSLVCIGMWLMTFINGSEQGLGPLQCCLLSPLLYSNDFLPISFPQGWPCHSKSLLLSLSFPSFLPSVLIHALTQTHNFLNSHLHQHRCTQAHIHHAFTFSRDPVCVCVFVVYFSCCGT